MLTSVELQGSNEMGGTIEAAINKAIGGMNGAEVAIVAGGARGGDKNALIAKVQAKQLRDPFYLDPQGMESIRFATAGVTAAQYSTRKRALMLIGELMLNAIGRNVEKQQNPGGSRFKELTANYAAYKKRKYGFSHPILRATGDLLKGLRVRITAK